MSSHHPDAARTPHRQYQFLDFTLDLESGFLRRADAEVPLRPKAFEALTYLVERHGRLVSRTELIEAVWPQTAVTDSSLAHCLLEIRRALGDDSQRLIRTVVRRGYVFAAPVSVSTTVPVADVINPASVSHGPLDANGRRTSFGSRSRHVTAILILPAVAAGSLLLLRSTPSSRSDHAYAQLTAFTDSATSPAVSPDGRMIAFIRGSSTFLDRGQIYVKPMPDGEPVAVTHDDREKMAPVFSPDGSRIAYTVYDSGMWQTWSVSVLGGEPRQMLTNAAALTWAGKNRVLFSEIKRGLQMGIVMATENRSDVRDVYVPHTDRMAHRSSASPDGRWVLIASEMNATGWLPCRLASVDEGRTTRAVGPPGLKCTHAVWSPDGQWMYFSAEIGGRFHTWRQKFPDGRPEQLTRGPADEEGIAMWPDGQSFVSSVGTDINSLWVHDEGNERQLTSEGYAYLPSFSPDGRTVYYLLRVPETQQWAAGELWAINLDTGNRRRVLTGMSMAHYDVSSDGARVVFVRTDPGKEGVWLARVDGRVSPVQLNSESDTRAFFGPPGTLVFEVNEAGAKYVIHARDDGSQPEKLSTKRIVNLEAVSPDRTWALVWPAGDDLARMEAYPINGGEPVHVCERCNDGDGGPARGRTPPPIAWSRDGNHVYLRFQWAPSNALSDGGKTYVLRLAAPNSLPPAFNGEVDISSMPGVQVIPRWGIFPGPRPSIYAYTRAATHRNLFRISLP